MMSPTYDYKVGHVIDVLRGMPEKSVQMVVTSPPYYKMRLYDGEQSVSWSDGTTGAYGQESDPLSYVSHTVLILREIRRVLRDDGVVFWNIGDSYAGSGKAGTNPDYWKKHTMFGKVGNEKKFGVPPGIPLGYKRKDLFLVPERVVIALQEDGWYVRGDIIWQKSGSMESCTDRPTRIHEFVWLLSKQEDYFWDYVAGREQGTIPAGTKGAKGSKKRLAVKGVNARPAEYHVYDGMRNMRSIWKISTENSRVPHYATFPRSLVRKCMTVATSEKGCCPKCGSPWERVWKKVRPEGWQDKGPQSEKEQGQRAVAKELYGGNQKTRTLGDIYGRAMQSRVETEGWKATCKCGLTEDQNVPCTVLDPFAGAGTTFLVAKEMGRSAIGIDIHSGYKDISEKREGLYKK